MLVLSTPDFLEVKNLASMTQAEICGLLEDNGYSYESRSLYVECNLQNRFKFQTQEIDFSILTNEPLVRSYLKGVDVPSFEEELEKLEEKISCSDHDILIFTLHARPTYSAAYKPFLYLLPLMKKLPDDKLKILAGDCNFSPFEDLEVPFIDYIIEGDPEEPLKKILEHEIKGGELDRTQGITIPTAEGLNRNGIYRHAINEKPKPEFKPETLRKHSKLNLLKKPIFRYRLGRGTDRSPDYSSYCSSGDFSYKDISKVVREIKQIHRETGAKHVRFIDFYLMNDTDYVLKLAKKLIKEDLEIYWSGRCRPTDESQEFYNKLSESGCRALYLDIGSVSQEALEKMGRDQSPQDTISSLSKIYEAGINPLGYFRVGHRGSNYKEFEENVNFMKKNRYLMGAEVRKSEILPTEKQKIYKETNREPSSFIDKSKGYGNLLDCSIKNGELPSKSTSEDRRKHLQRTADLRLFARNYFRDHPITFIRKMLRKIYLSKTNDLSYSFRKPRQQFY